MAKFLLISIFIIWGLCALCSKPNIDHWEENGD